MDSSAARFRNYKKQLTSAEKVLGFCSSGTFKQVLVYLLGAMKDVQTADRATLREALSLVMNCCHLEVRACMEVKSSGIIPMLVVEFERSADADLKGTFARLLSNVCRLKEIAYSLITSRSGPSLLNALVLSIDISNLTPERRTVIEHSLRVVQSLTKHDSYLCKQLLTRDVVFAMSHVLSKMVKSVEMLVEYERLVLKIVSVLAQIVTHFPSGDKRIEAQLIESEIVPHIVSLCFDTEQSRVFIHSGTRIRSSVVQIFTFLTDSSRLRLELAKTPTIPYLHELFTNNNPSNNSVMTSQAALKVLCKLCKDVATRIALREYGSIDAIVRHFASDSVEPLSEECYNLLSAFACFRFDQEGFRYVVLSTGFVEKLSTILQRISEVNSCQHAHTRPDVNNIEEEVVIEEENLEVTSKAQEVIEVDMASDTGEQPIEEDATSFRPDSPSYSALLNAQDGVPRATEAERPMCKDILGEILDTPVVGCWAMAGATSPGPSWSPSRQMSPPSSPISSRRSSSPPAAKRVRLDSPAQPTDSRPSECSSSGTFDLHHVSYEPRCPSTRQRGAADNRHVEVATLSLLSWMSHSDENVPVYRKPVIAARIFENVIQYVARTCSPSAQVGRIFKRFVRNDHFLQTLLQDVQLHRLILQQLCRPRCAEEMAGEEMWCARCQRLYRVGCDLLDAFRVQVDTDYGSGLLSRMLVSQGSASMEHLQVACAAALLIRNPSHKHRLLSGQRGLRLMLDFLCGLDVTALTADNEELLFTADCLLAAPNKVLLKTHSRALLSCLPGADTLCPSRCCDFAANAEAMCGVRVHYRSGDVQTLDRDWLASKSEVFCAMFGSSTLMREAISADLHVGQMGDLSDPAFLAFLHLLNTCDTTCPAFACLTVADVYHLLHLCRMHLHFSLETFVLNQLFMYLLGCQCMMDSLPALLDLQHKELLDRAFIHVFLNAARKQFLLLLSEFARQEQRREFCDRIEEFVLRWL